MCLKYNVLCLLPGFGEFEFPRITRGFEKRFIQDPRKKFADGAYSVFGIKNAGLKTSLNMADSCKLNALYPFRLIC